MTAPVTPSLTNPAAGDPSLQIKWVGCPPSNFRKGRPAPYKPEAIVLHISTASLASCDAQFNDPATHVSAHYIVGKKGEIHQYVLETDSAFHAGVVVRPTWNLLKPKVNPNFYTIGIEHEGQAGDLVPPAQLATSTALVAAIAARWTIPLDEDHLVAHHQIRASKTCPGSSITPAIWLAAVATSAPAAAQPQAALLEVTSAVRVRTSPGVGAAILRILPAGQRLVAAAHVTGDAVSGNDAWYGLSSGGYIWSGAVKVVEPANA